MKIIYLHVISSLIVPIVFASCVIFKLEYASFKESNKQEYWFHNGNNEFVLHFWRWTDNSGHKGYLGGCKMETNGRFKFKKKNEKNYDEAVFLVDLKAVDLRINDEKIPLSRICLRKYKNKIFIYTTFDYGKGSEEYQNLFFRIIPSDFITNNGKRAINDTISVKIFEKVH